MFSLPPPHSPSSSFTFPFCCQCSPFLFLILSLFFVVLVFSPLLPHYPLPPDPRCHHPFICALNGLPSFTSSFSFLLLVYINILYILSSFLFISFLYPIPFFSFPSFLPISLFLFSLCSFISLLPYYPFLLLIFILLSSLSFPYLPFPCYHHFAHFHNALSPFTSVLISRTLSSSTPSPWTVPVLPKHLSSLPQVGWMRADTQTILSLHKKVVTHNTRISVTHSEPRTWNLHIRIVSNVAYGFDSLLPCLI